MAKRDTFYQVWHIIYGIIIFVYLVVGGISVKKDILDSSDFFMFLFAILSIGLAYLAILQAKGTEKIATETKEMIKKTKDMIDTVSVESTYVDNPWIEGAKLFNQADRGDHILCSAVTGWATESKEVKEYNEANIRALNRGVHITRIFSFFNPKSALTNKIEGIAKEQKKTLQKIGNFEIRVYYDEKAEKEGSIDYCILESDGKPTLAVLWLYDPGHPNSILPGFRISNNRILGPLWDDFKRKYTNSILLEDYFDKTKQHRT